MHISGSHLMLLLLSHLIQIFFLCYSLAIQKLARFSFLPLLFLFFCCSLVIKKLGKVFISSLLLLLLRCCSLANASKSLSGFFGMKIDFFNLPSPLTNGHKPRCNQLGTATPSRISWISSSSRTCCIQGFFREVCRFWIKTVDRTIVVLVVFVRLILLLFLAIFRSLNRTTM